MADAETVNVQDADPAEVQAGDSPSLESVLAELDGAEGEQAQEQSEPQEPAKQPEGGESQAEAAEQGEQKEAAQESKEKPEGQDKLTEERLERIRREEQRAREELSQERQRLEDQRRQLDETRQQERQRVEQERRQIRERAQYDLGGLLEDLGIDKGDLEQYSRHLYAYAKGKPEAAQQIRSRKAESEVEQLRRELQELKQGQAQREQQTQAEQAVQRYLDEAEAAATPDKAPLVAKMAESNRELARGKIHATAEDLLRETGRPPSQADVLARLEKTWRAEMKSLGADPDALLGSSQKTEPAPQEQSQPDAPTEKTPEAAGETKSGDEPETDPQDSEPRASDPWEERRELIRLIEEGRLE